MAWIPLESNPEVMTKHFCQMNIKFMHNLGVPEKLSIIDVYGLEPDLLAIVPRPVLAVILLYPLSAEGDFQDVEGKDPKDDLKDALNNVFHFKQCTPNACGTIALIHGIANNLNVINLQDGFLKTFLDASKDLSYTKRGELLINAKGIIDTHKESAQKGQTEVPGEDQPVYHHFVAFVHKDGSLYELDGRKTRPIDHGSTSQETLLEDAARVCKEYMARDPEEMRFTVLALVSNA